MKVFADTSALLVLLDGSASHHEAVAQCWREFLSRDDELLTSNYILVETLALVQRRLGVEAVRVFNTDFLPLLSIVWVDSEIHHAALTALLTAGLRGLSFVDCTSFVIMRESGIRVAFTLDSDFARQGFEAIPSPAQAP